VIAPRSQWKALGTSVTGTSHLKSNLPCQDALQWRAGSNEILLVAAADGAGSAKHADAGSSLAAKTAIDSLVAKFLHKPLSREKGINDLKEVVHSARAKLIGESEQRDTPVREFATTLLIAAIGRDWIAAAQIGDGAVLGGESAENLKAITRPTASEYLNETQFLTSETAIADTQFVFEETTIRHVAVFSDGLQMLCLKMTDASPHPAFFKPLFHFLTSATHSDKAQKQLESFLESPRIKDRTDDDLTLFLASVTDKGWEM
jgi:serine/threonine protein phosphatase PrpC